ncbi:MAG: FkbM family methyltransferase [Phycisphaerales bacterium]|jgi:FkbM family methyltransferase|nr:FkbM family methyltransferase [Phycisphaerales bacterium]
MNLPLACRLLARAARYRWKLNVPEIAHMRAVLPRGGTVIDIGAHKGAYAFWMARQVGAKGTVLAVEPQAPVAAELARSLSSWGLNQVHVIHAAASDHTGHGTINIPADSSHGASLNPLGPDRRITPTPVRLETIDHLADQHNLTSLHFIKIDAEGHELPIIDGALQAIARFRPHLLIEADARAHGGGRAHLDHLEQRLAPLGYHGSFHDQRSWRPLSQIDVTIHQTYGSPHYCPNILFTPTPLPAAHAAAKPHATIEPKPRTTAARV